jgi:hypothetical protein
MGVIPRIGWLARLGVTETAVPLPSGINSLDEYLDALGWIGAGIIPQVG